MSMGFSRLVRSATRLVRAVVDDLISAAKAFAAGNRAAAVDLVRRSLQAVHDDILTVLVARAAPGLPERDKVGRILIVKLDRIGDMVNTMPVFDVLRARYPAATIDLLAHPAVLTLLDGDSRINNRLPYVSSLYHVVPLRPPGLAGWRLAFSRQLADYSLVVYLRGTFATLPAAARCRTVAAKFVEGEPVITRYLRPLGEHPVNGALPQPRLHVRPETVTRLRASLWGAAAGPHVAIHPISGAEGKQWPLARFAGLADRLHDDLGAAVVFLAAPNERPQLQALEALCTRSHRFETTLRLGEVSGAIKAAQLFIGNDSGLAHIAAGVGTPEVVIWGGSNLEMARPVTPPGFSQVLYRDVPCRATCAEVVCTSPERLRCLTDISEADVLDAARAMLAGTQSLAAGAASH